MSRPKSNRGPLSRAARGIILVAMASVAPAQDEAEEAAEAVNEINMIQLGDQQIAQWVFGNRVLFQGRNVGPTHLGRIEQELGLQLALVEAAVPLSEPQRRKLELAGRGDIDRFLDRFEAFQSQCPAGPVSQDKYLELNRKAQPLAARYRAGLHGEGSLFRKTLRSALDAEQSARFESLQAERSRKRYQALVKATVAMIDQKIPLDQDQRERLIELTLRETTPPEAPVEGYSKYNVVLLLMSKVPEDSLRPIFADEEWPAFQTLLLQGRAAEGQLLRAQADDFDE